jgi:hypothetical protein
MGFYWTGSFYSSASCSLSIARIWLASANMIYWLFGLSYASVTSVLRKKSESSSCRMPNPNDIRLFATWLPFLFFSRR